MVKCAFICLVFQFLSGESGLLSKSDRAMRLFISACCTTEENLIAMISYTHVCDRVLFDANKILLTLTLE